MQKFVLFFSVVLLAANCMSQTRYHCVFIDTTSSAVPDSIFKYLAKKNNLSAKEVDKFLEQQKSSPLYRHQLRIVTAELSKTIIVLDKHSIRGNLTIEIMGNFRLQPIDSMTYKDFDSILFNNDEIFNAAPTSSGFSETAWDRPKRAYRPTGKKVSILDFQCDEYISTDSTCYIWITQELPEYINPGIRTNNVHGAVLGFKYIQKTGTSTKTILSKIEKVL